MRIAVDARPLSGPQTGIARYTLNLLRHMIPMGHQWFLYSDKPLQVDLGELVEDCSVQVRCGDVRPKSAGSVVASQWQFSRWATQDVVDLFWSPRHHLPLLLSRDIARVVTIHDLVWRRFPETMMWQNLLVERALMAPSIAHADRVICVSRFTASEVSRYYPSALGKCDVIHEAPSLTTPGADTAITEGSYLLFVGTLEPRKNLARLLRAYARLVQHEVVPELVIAGGEGWGDTGLAALVRKLELEGRVRLTGFVDDAELQDLYRGACALLMPSLYEGFGLPALEAMSFGIPVIASSTSSLPEVVGDGGILVNPYSESEIAAAILRLVEDPALRSELSLKARQRSRIFSWDRAARQTLELLEQTLARHEPKAYRHRVLEQLLE
jgi:glycosyltransferase involved in cell wall biosynthesis